MGIPVGQGIFWRLKIWFEEFLQFFFAHTAIAVGYDVLIRADDQGLRYQFYLVGGGDGAVLVKDNGEGNFQFPGKGAHLIHGGFGVDVNDLQSLLFMLREAGIEDRCVGTAELAVCSPEAQDYRISSEGSHGNGIAMQVLGNKIRGRVTDLQSGWFIIAAGRKTERKGKHRDDAT